MPRICWWNPTLGNSTLQARARSEIIQQLLAWVPDCGSQRHFACHACLRVDGGKEAGAVLPQQGSGHPWLANILQLDAGSVFGVADPCSTVWDLPSGLCLEPTVLALLLLPPSFLQTTYTKRGKKELLFRSPQMIQRGGIKDLEREASLKPFH